MKHLNALLEDMDQKFKGHVLQHKSVSEDRRAGFYHLRTPGTSNYWFQLNFAPGVLTISGDISEFIITGKSLEEISSMALQRPADLLRYLSCYKREGVRIFSHDKAGQWLQLKRSEILGKYPMDSEGDVDCDELEKDDEDTLDRIEAISESLYRLERSKESMLRFQYETAFLREDIEDFDEDDFSEIDPQILWKIAAIRCFARVMIEQEFAEKQGQGIEA